MSQSFLSPTIITRNALKAFVNSLVFSKGANRQYDKQFASTGASPSGKIGPTLTIRKPNKFSVNTGAALNVADVTEASTTFTISTRKHVDFAFPTQDLTLTIDDWMERYGARAVERLANEVDYDGLSEYINIANWTGTAGTAPGTANVWLGASQLLKEMACPVDGKKYVVMNPAAEAATVSNLTGLFNPQMAISRQYETGEMGSALGLVFKTGQNVNAHTCGTRTAASETTVSGTQTEGASTLVCTTGSGKTFTKGDVFTIAGIYSVNPMSGQSTASLQNFVVTSAATASSTAVTLSIYPSLTTTGINKTISSLPVTTTAITFKGTASTAYAQNLCYHQDAFALVTADLELPRGVDFAARENYDGISLRIVRQYSIDSDQIPCRIDVLYGWKTLYPEWACRVTG